jgi:hypothetical protein
MTERKFLRAGVHEPGIHEKLCKRIGVPCLYVARVDRNTCGEWDDDFVAERALNVALKLAKTSRAISCIVETDPQLVHPGRGVRLVCNCIQCSEKPCLCADSLCNTRKCAACVVSPAAWAAPCPLLPAHDTAGRTAPQGVAAR